MTSSFLHTVSATPNGRTNAGDTQALRTSRSQENLLSRSLGRTIDFLPSRGKLQRHISNFDPTKVSYSGYLLKRSNKPVDEDSNGYHTDATLHHANTITVDSIVSTPELPDLQVSSTSAGLSYRAAPTLTNVDQEDAFFILPADTGAWHAVDTPSGQHSTPMLPFVTPSPLHVAEQRSSTSSTRDSSLESSLGSSTPYVTNRATQPLQPPAEQQQYHLKEAPNQTTKSSLETGIEVAAKFFGLSMSKSNTNKVAVEQPKVKATPPSTVSLSRKSSTASLPRKMSKPIKFGSQTSMHEQESFAESRHKQHSASGILEASSPSNRINNDDAKDDCRQPPADYVHPKDKHIWRSKYCILQGGVLYFYRNPTDANSVEAAGERNQPNVPATEAIDTSSYGMKDLSKSPTARHMLIGSLRSSHQVKHIWEKRVYLCSVGVARSAEAEYGKHCLELIAVQNNDNEDEDDPDGDVDKLVLQARNSDEMREWLFQFHLAVRPILKNFASMVATPAELDLRSSDTTGSDKLHRLEHNGSSLSHCRSFNPSYLPAAAVLSHGHGRSNRNRLSDLAKNVRPLPSTSMGDGGTFLSGKSYPNISMSMEMNRVFSSNSSSGSNRTTPQASSLLSHSAYPSSPNEKHPKLLPPTSSMDAKLSALKSQESKSNEGDNEKTSSIFKKDHSSKEKRKYVPPHLRRKKYVPPHLRNKAESDATNPDKSLLSLAERSSAAPEQDASSTARQDSKEENVWFGRLNILDEPSGPGNRGGCANPEVVRGSILDDEFKARRSSNLGKINQNAFGCFGGGRASANSQADGAGARTPTKLRFEVGAASECGARETNQDSYLVISDVLKAFKSLENEDSESTSNWNTGVTHHNPSLFAIFDGHSGDEAARYATEKLAQVLFEETLGEQSGTQNIISPSTLRPSNVQNDINNAMLRLDSDFCKMCTAEGRDWDSGATALVALLANEHLVIGNLGDCRGLICKSVPEDMKKAMEESWNELDIVIDNHGHRSSSALENNSTRSCMWREMTRIHSPSREDEKDRIEAANGWVDTSIEIPLGQFQRMDLMDRDAAAIFHRCMNEPRNADDSSSRKKASNSEPNRMIDLSTLCNGLAVSRALGDRGYKAEYNGFVGDPASEEWECPLDLLYPDDHNKRFKGDLVSNVPEFQDIRVGMEGVSEEFVVLACDGLWDVLDADDVLRFTRDFLYRQKWTAKMTAARVCEIAISLGSSDNVTVIVLRIFPDENENGKKGDPAVDPPQANDSKTG